MREIFNQNAEIENNGITKFDVEVNFDKWSNDNAMKMSTLLQIINMEYESDIDDLINGLNDILIFIKKKYEIIGKDIEFVMDFEIGKENECSDDLDKDELTVSYVKAIGGRAFQGFMYIWGLQIVPTYWTPVDLNKYTQDNPKALYEMMHALDYFQSLTMGVLVD